MGQNRFRHLVSAVHATKTVAQSIANASFVTITWDAEDFDTDAVHDNATNNSRLTAPVVGKYHVYATLLFEQNATGRRVSRLVKNGGTVIGRGNDLAATDLVRRGVVGVWTVSLAAADYVEVQWYQDSGGALEVLGNATEQGISSFWMFYVGE